jgi:hypothetical protein
MQSPLEKSQKMGEFKTLDFLTFGKRSKIAMKV